LSAGIGLALVNVFQPGAGLPPEVREQLMTTYRAQAQGLQAAGTTHFGVDTFVSMVPRNPIQAAAGMDLLGVIFFSLVFGAALTLVPEERAAARAGARSRGRSRREDHRSRDVARPLRRVRTDLLHDVALRVGTAQQARAVRRHRGAGLAAARQRDLGTPRSASRWPHRGRLPDLH